jgi:hypothetical protein
MRSITVHQDQLEYVGLFATPAFGLLAQPDTVVSGLYHAFLGLHSGLSEFQIESSGTALARDISVSLTDRGTYRFTPERVDWTYPSAGSSELDAAVLARGEAWLRAAQPELKFQDHYYTYFAHCSIDQGSASEFLLSLASPHLPGLGENQGTGLIFHATFPEHGWAMQITIDHSNVVPAGLYVRCVTAITADHVQHPFIVRHIDELFRRALTSVGLTLVRFVG